MTTRFFLMVFMAVLPSLALAHDESPPLYHAFRLELDAGKTDDNSDIQHWNLDGWVGSDENKLWMKSIGEMSAGHLARNESWLLYSRNVDTFWDVQFGLRHDTVPTSQTFFVMGVTGMAPYRIETELHLFIGDLNNSSVRWHAKKDIFLTQQWVLQPYAETDMSVSHVGEMDASAGLQLRYEVTRKFAPYLKLESQHFSGGAKGERGDQSEALLTAGIKLLF